MDGVQRNFSMMADKIDRMRCLRERCDNYVRLIKLTLDETIKEQNSLLNGSAIHNRLKYLGVMDKPKSLSNTFNTDKYHKNIDFNNKYKYLVFDDGLGFGQHKKNSNLNTNDMYLSNDYSSYNTNYKPRVHDFSSVYDDQNNTYYMPINSKKYGKTVNFRTPDTQEYQVYYFPTSKPIAQYPRHTTERFYRRKPIKQYPKEEVPYWPTRYPKPVRVIEREPSYSMIDYGYRSTDDYRVGKSNIQSYTPEHRTRYYPTNDTNIYHGHDDSDYYYEPHLGQRSYSSITRPCSLVYHRDILCDRTQLENSSSLLEKKIRDYVWNPHKERIEKYTTPSYEKSTYYTNFKPLTIKHQEDETFRTRSPLGLDYLARNRKDEVTKEVTYKKNSKLTSPERRYADDEYIQPHKDNDHYSESTIYKKKTDKPSTFPKRISFDLGIEHIELPNHTNSIEENTNANYNTKDHKLVLGRKESNAKLEDQRRTSLLPKDDFSVSISKQKVSPSHTNVSSRRQSLSKQEKLAPIGNSFESDKYINLKNNFQGNDSSLSEKNEHSYNNDRINYDNNNDVQIYPKTQDDKNNMMLKDVSNNNTYRDVRRDSNENRKKKMMETTEKTNFSYQDHIENTKNINNNLNITERRESYKGKQKLKKENSHGNITSSNGVDNKLENEYNNKNRTNTSSKNRISSPVVDYSNGNSNMNKYNTNEYETDHKQQFINKNDSEEKQNNFETIQPYNVVNDSSNEIDITNTVTQVSSDFKTIPKDQEPLNDELTNNTNYYQDHPDDDDIKEYPTHEYETQPEHVADDEHFYTDEVVDSNTEVIVNNNIEPIQQNEFDDKNNVHDEYYYQNPTDDKKDNLTENQHENPDSQVEDVEKQHANDDYYYQEYSNVDQQEQPENQYSKRAIDGEYTSEHVEHDDYYYQNHDGDDIKEQQGDQQYADTNYQGNYVDQPPAHDDYYYQNYSNGDLKAQPENQYTESDRQGEYVAEQNMVHDDYYYQNHSKEGTNENQVDQHYQEHQGNYGNGEQDNYYYENNNSNVNPERHPEDQYDENAQQETYTGDQHTNDGYYYQEGNTNYDETVPKEQYDGYVDDNQDANAAYYTNPNVENYDQQQHDYENNSYPTQKAEYIEQYEQNADNENNGYSENIDESQPTSQIANEQK